MIQCWPPKPGCDKTALLPVHVCSLFPVPSLPSLLHLLPVLQRKPFKAISTHLLVRDEAVLRSMFSECAWVSVAARMRRTQWSTAEGGSCAEAIAGARAPSTTRRRSVQLAGIETEKEVTCQHKKRRSAFLPSALGNRRLCWSPFAPQQRCICTSTCTHAKFPTRRRSLR